MKFYKDWTILIYCNGNNDLEPEMCLSKLNAQNSGSDENINVIMEIGREEKYIVNLLRSSSTRSDENRWNGVKRYYINKGGSILLKDLGKINMADPKSLYNFIKYGVENYPAKKYMLILGGHGYGHVGFMTDYSQDAPYIMGIQEMIKSINETNIKIDLLILDTCFSNNIEVIYELGKENNHSVQNMMTYIKEGPISGLDYCTLIEIIKKNINIDVDILIKQIIDNIKLNLVAFRIDSLKLKKLKRAINDLSYSYLRNNEKQYLSPSKLISNFDENNPWNDYLKEYYKKLAQIIIYYKRHFTTKHPLVEIFLINLDDINKLAIYYKFGFAKNNYWTYILSNKSIYDTIPIYIAIDLKPIQLSTKDIYRYTTLTNPALDNIRISSIVENLYKYKKWEFIC